MNNLVVCGCSFSDRTHVPAAYGDYLAEMLGFSYTHLAGGAGSDMRGIRLLTQAIMRGEVTEKSLVVFQLTGVERCELPSQLTDAEYKQKLDRLIGKEIGHRIPAVERTWLGNIVSKFKMNSHNWQECQADKNTHTSHENNAVDEAWHAEELFTQHYSLKELCKAKGITLSLIRHRTGGFIQHIKNIRGEEWIENYFDTELWMVNPWSEDDKIKYGLAPDDQSHLSTVGHIAFAEMLLAYYREKGVI